MSAPSQQSPGPAPEPATPPAATPAAAAAEPARSDAGHWSAPIDRLRVGAVAPGGINLNVAGRRVASPVQGFGKLWQKTYRIRLDDVDLTPEQVVAAWKRAFADLWPGKNRFYGTAEGMVPGEVGLINTSVGGLRLATGVLVLYADDTSFTVITPEGHSFSGFNTFSADTADGATCAQVQVLMRSADPLYEVGLTLFGHRMEDTMWRQTLQGLAATVGSAVTTVEMRRECVDRRRQWGHWRNVWHNAMVRTTVYTVATPLRWSLTRLRSG